ncbi:MAG: DUF2147 domain-containing protein [Saccharospirillaceae bacterium]|nr:DUF2147 domain-containing protein [Pseudomonadales bacterium]NRB79505.1 DUF2147 domain-containing protein [Saccharospirillaceae bacterium]
MKYLITSLLMLISMSAFSADITGKWKSIDDETGKAKSIIEIWFDGKRYQGKIVKLLSSAEVNPLCTECKGSLKDQPIIGMQIITDAKKSGKKYKKGEILDPSEGKSYSLVMQLQGDDKLKVRGYIGFALLGRTQYWYRVVDTDTDDTIQTK